MLFRSADDTNHVLMFKAKFSHHEKPSASIKKIGINEATTFPGLCKKHDERLFADIEKKVIDINNEYHHFLVSYRAVLNECYSKTSTYERIKNIAEDSSKDGNSDEFAMTIMILMAYSHYLGMFYTNKIKKLLDISLINKRYDSELLFGVRSLPYPLPIFLSSVFTPPYDFEEKIINNFQDYKIPPNYFFLSVLPSKSDTLIFYSILKRQKENLGNIFYQLENIDDQYFLHYLSELIIKYTENFVLSPSYWDKFSEQQKQVLIKYYNDTARNPKISYDKDVHNIFKYSYA